ncbi:MAG: Eco57I restriction-modification methylase domain-containing protein [Candidatus Hodarchaeales archaeon]
MQPKKSTNRNLGQYFTPEFIAEYIISNTLGEVLKSKKPESIKVLDPSVGQGIFLKKSFEHFMGYYDKKREPRNSSISQNLFGVDIDTSQLTCDLLFGINIKKCDFLISSWDIMFPGIDQGFDVIVGNPPWGVKLDYSSEILKDYKTAVKQYDSWVLFLEKSLKFLREGGRLGFVLPNTLLTNENYTEARKIILESTSIIKILNLGDGWFKGVSQPCMIIILEKGGQNTSSKTKIVEFVPNNTESISLFINDSFKYNAVNQDQFLSNSGNEFNIWEIGNEEILRKVERENVKALRHFVTNARGVELNRKGIVVQCQTCGWWNPPPKNKIICCNPTCNSYIKNSDPKYQIVSLEGKENSVPFLTGAHVNRYYLKSPAYIEKGYLGINYKKDSFYHGTKLLLRKTGHGIQTAIDYNNRWVSQVVYIFKLRKDTKLSLEFIMGVLNSKLMHYYYYRKYADPNRKDFPHFTQRKFLELPIKVPEDKLEESLMTAIGQKARELQTVYQEKQQQESLTTENGEIEVEISLLEKDIDNMVFRLYNLSEKDKKDVQDQVTQFLKY